MADNKDVDALQRRGRRRLIGAIALVLAAAVVLPMVFDSEPRQPPPAVSVRIPSEDDSAFASRVAPAPAQAAPAAPEKAAPAAPEKAPAAAPEKAATAVPEKAASAAAAPPATDASATAQFIVPVAALASPEKLRELTAALKAAQLPFYTQPIATAKGQVTRVRAGPFASRDAAEKALARMRGLGLKPGAVAPKS